MRRAGGDRVVVLVGASSGIGRATAHRLARRGDRLVLASRSTAALEATARECAARAPGGRRPLAVPTDVRDRVAVTALLDAAWAAHGRVDAVVDLAAVMVYGRFEEVPPQVFDDVVATNLLGAANVAREVVRRFRAQGHGHLVLVGSLLGAIPAPWVSAYVTSKWGLHGLADSLRVETRDAPRLHVSLVMPGGVDTPIYLRAGSYAGREGRPPVPVDPPEKVARGMVRLLDHPRPRLSVGRANRPWAAGFRLAPRLFEALVRPGMTYLGLSRRPVAPHPGAVRDAAYGIEAVHGRWPRTRRRRVTLRVAAVVAVLGVRRAVRRTVDARRSGSAQQP